MKSEKKEQQPKTEKKSSEKTCTDQHCPIHGNISIRGRTFTGIVSSDKMSKSVTVIWNRTVFIPKYERYEEKRSKVKAHNPECLDVKAGDKVKITECRPISKTKHFVVVEKLA